MQWCPVCGSEDLHERIVDLPAHHYGLSNVMLVGVRVSDCASCGESLEEFPNLSDVEAALRGALARTARQLSGREFAFLRRTLGATARQYADWAGLHPVSVSRIENCEDVSAERSALVRVLTMLDLIGGNAMAAMDLSGPTKVEVDLRELPAAVPKPTPELVFFESSNVEEWVHTECSETYRAISPKLRLATWNGIPLEAWEEAA